jgi:hypothetical protein
MTFHSDLKRALIAQLGKENVTFMPGWDRKQRGFTWKRGGAPLALMAHHTAGAATDSTDPKHPGNRKAADESQAKYVQNMNPSGVPGANFTLGRSGHLWVHAAYPCWHSGAGTFKGKAPYDTLRIPDNAAADYLMGVEAVSKGMKRDWTAKQKDAFGGLARAVQTAAGWKGFTKRLPNHKTWAGNRKVDTRYTEDTLRKWAESD